MAIVVVGMVSACGRTDDRVLILNDLERPVEVLQCANNLCVEEFHETGVLQPGDSFYANTSTTGVPNPYLVRELDGERLGCLPVVFPEPAEGLIAKVSEQVPCQKKYDESKFWPPRTSTAP